MFPFEILHAQIRLTFCHSTDFSFVPSWDTRNNGNAELLNTTSVITLNILLCSFYPHWPWPKSKTLAKAFVRLVFVIPNTFSAADILIVRLHAIWGSAKIQTWVTHVGNVYGIFNNANFVDYERVWNCGFRNGSQLVADMWPATAPPIAQVSIMTKLKQAAK